MSERVVINGKTYVKSPTRAWMTRSWMAGVLAVMDAKGGLADLTIAFKKPNGDVDVVVEFEKIVLGTSQFPKSEQHWIIKEFYGMYTEEKTV